MRRLVKMGGGGVGNQFDKKENQMGGRINY